MKGWHAIVGVVIAVVWFGTLGYVLTHGRDDASSVNVYTELPPGFTAELESQGVSYSGLSPVDSGTVQQAVSHTSIGNEAGTPATPIVLRTSFSDTGKHPKYHDTPALMVVVPEGGSSASPSASSSATAGSTVAVAFLDPTTYRELQQVTYAVSG
jgi:hypothetical protein